MELSGIDIVIRLSDTSELPLLHRCVFSVLGQSHRVASLYGNFSEPLRLHVMLCRFSSDELQMVRTATRMLRPFDETASITLHNWRHPEPFDLHVPLLNWSLEVAKGRYFTCLDPTDLLFPGACAKLLTRLRATRAAIALGGMATQPVRWWGDVVLPLPATSPAPGPLPGEPGDENVSPVFVLDRARMPLREQVFRVGRPGAEVAEFVRRLRAQHLADTECMTDLLGVRQVPG